MTYRCNNSFISHYYGKHYVVGSEIGDHEYNNLTAEEKKNFTKSTTGEYAAPGIVSGEVNSGMHGLSEDSYRAAYENDSPPSPDSYSPPENNDFNFGGGDGGGAGASDDY